MRTATPTGHRVRFVMLAALLATAGLSSASCSPGEESNNSKADTGGSNDEGGVTPPGDEKPGITVTPTSGLRTSETGGSATFTIALNSKPQGSVTIALSSSNEAEGTLDRKSVVFTPENYSSPQTVTVTGVDDTKADGTQSYTIVTAKAVSDDVIYNGMDAEDVTVTNTDDESAGITVTPTKGLKTTEMGEMATFSVRLNTKPTGDVTIDLSSSNAKEGVASPKALVFTADNWAAPQTVTVTGIDDAVADGPQTYSILTAPAKSADKDYAGLDADDVTLINTDDETAGITVTASSGPTGGLTTSESGASATFTIRLNTKPTANVTIPLSSSKPSEGTLSPSSVTFTPENWNAPQTVTVTGVDDAAADGSQTYKAVTGAATSTDTNYAGLDAEDVSLSNTDDETAGFTVTPVELVTNESGGTATFTVRLNSKPTANVTFGLTSSNEKEGTVSPAALTFTALNWNAPQTVTVTGVDDSVADGNQVFKIITAAATSSDAQYEGLNPADVSVTNTDNDSAGVTLSADTLTTTEAGGTTTFSIRLNSQPTANVTIPLTSSKPGEGTVSPASVTFTSSNWNAPQTITVTGVDDKIADGNQVYAVRTGAATSADPRYAGIDAADVAVSNTDDDSAGITVAPLSAGPLVTTESGGSAIFTLKLNSQPTGNVTIPLFTSNGKEGTVSPTTVTFTTLNWNAPQAVTVTGVDDAVADGSQVFIVGTGAAVSTDTAYNGMNAADLSVTNTDDDSAGVTVSPTTGLTTTEVGGSATFTIKLNSQPTGNVTIPLSSSKTSEGTVSPASVTFTALNWNAPQTITVTGVDDKIADGNQPYSILTGVATSTDASYSGLNPADVTVTNTDDDSASITVSATTATTTEAGGSATFTIKLNSQPTANVTIPLSSSKTSEGTVSPSTVTFTALNWNAPQTITVTGVDDAIADGNQTYSILTAAATSSDPGYSGMNASDVTVTNTDNDSAGITVSPTTGLATTEAGGTATFTIRLNSQPTSNVVIPLSSSRPTEGTVSPTSLVFTSLNWNAPQTVTVTGVDDAIADGSQPYTIVTGAAASGDTGYSGMNAADVSVSNTDNDSAGITLAGTSGLTTTEAGGSASFTIRLNSQPTANVTIPLSSSRPSEGTVSPTSVTFTALNWNAPQTVTMTGVDDKIADGAQPYTIVTGAATSTDSGYSGMNAADVSVTNTDNDSAGITLSTTGPLTTTEAGGTATFTIRLNSQPTSNVTIPLSSSRPSEGTVSPASLTFTALNWESPQIVTVTGVNDAIADGAQPYTILTGAASSSDSGYSGMNPLDVAVSNTDNDSAGITLSTTGPLTTTEAGGAATFTIRLNSQPTASVTIGLSSSNALEGTVSPNSVTFDAFNWNAPQTVTVTGVNDAVADGSQVYSVVTAPAVSIDTGYSGLDALNVSVTNTDNDSAGITLSTTGPLTTTEAGGSTSFTVRLNSQPTASVVIPISSSRPSEGTVSASSLTFTTTNWASPQTITITGVDDAIADGNASYTIVTGAATSSDATYSGMNASDVSVSNTDNDSAGFTITPGTPLTTTEAGGTASFSVRLNSEPTATVTIPVSSSNLNEGTVSTASLVFTTTNWMSPQSVVVTGVNDFVADGNQPYSILLGTAVSTDGNYGGKNPSDVSVTNNDNDTASIIVSSVSGPTSEAGGTATFTIRLNSQPTADVTIGLSSSKPTEGTVSPASLTFTSSNWNVDRTVTVTGVDDLIDDGDATYSIVTAAAVSSDSKYSGADAIDVAMTNTDNDTAGIIVTPPLANHTSEVGGTSVFGIRLRTQPTANVTIPLSSSDTTEGHLGMVSSVTFTSSNWNVNQTVTVYGVDDAIDDGNVSYQIVTGAAISSDPAYSGLASTDVDFINDDNDDPVLDCTTTVCGPDCTAINKKYPALKSGPYLIDPKTTAGPFTVYCADMENPEVKTKTEWLSVQEKTNFSQFSSKGRCASCGDSTVFYYRLRFDVYKLYVDTSNMRFTNIVAGSEECYVKNKCVGRLLSWASAGSCAGEGDASGHGEISLVGTSFVVNENPQNAVGNAPNGKADYSADRRRASFAGGGICGSYGIGPSTSPHPISAAAYLKFSP